MLSLSKKTDYAIIALAHLAQNDGGLCSAREIASKFRVPAALLMNVLKTLHQGELVTSLRGARGGYSLAKRPETISLADIVIAVEGPIRLAQCTAHGTRDDDVCELLDICPVKRPVQRIHARLENFLGQITLADIVRESEDTGTRVALSLNREPCKPTGCCSSAPTAFGATT
ncbi:MAG TPA: Rrf2 family transcriptional regulator [Phycisphaerae bacterium]|nr:Rrf2 family transcriptional regulator [Phycisphaerae bacterium]